MEYRGLPNFLIVGMAKCGTSSLANYISQHPDVYISRRKEPRFITSMCGKFPENGPKDHLVRKWYISDIESYKLLFKNRTEKCVGEASADTLYFYEDTIPVIKKYIGSPKIIIIIRDPVKRAFSAYKHLVRDERENLPFAQALKEENTRIEANWEMIYHYTQASFYYSAIKAFKDNFQEVLVLLSEDLKNKPDSVFRQLFDFLNVDSGFEVKDMAELNRSGKPRSQMLHYNLQGRGLLTNIARPVARFILPKPEKRAAIRRMIRHWNLKEIEFPGELEHELRSLFVEDIEKTAKLTGYDLNHWLTVNQGGFH